VSGRAALPPHTKDAFLGGRVTLLQPQRGHRAGLDAALLQALVPEDASGLLVDMGAGVGTVAFSAAARAPALTAVALERDAGLLTLAAEALRLPENAGFASRVRLLQADAGDAGEVREALADVRAADWVVMNPPFDSPGRGRGSPDPGRLSAHMGDADLLQVWCRTAATLLRPGGRLGIIHRAEALAEVLEALPGPFGGIRILPAHPAEGAAATRILVRAELASRAPLSILPGLVLHRPGGAWTDEADAVLRGQAALAL
jgi:tRNA1(Val) A37 N6-methylase TrmN6